MSVRDLTILGTASQVPTKHRNHNGYLLRWDGVGVLFDPGEGTQRQMIRAGVTASMINRICITHFHGDHCLGFASMVQRISLDRVPHPVHVHYPASGQVYYDRLRRASIFHDVSDLRACPIKGGGEQAKQKEFKLTALSLDHGVPCYGYRIEEETKVRMDPAALARLGLSGPAVGELARKGSIMVGSTPVTLEEVSHTEPGQSFAFVMDTRICDNAFELAKGVDLLICESTYLHRDAKMAKDNGHMTATQAATIAKEAGAGRLLLSHFSQRYPRAQEFQDEAGAIFENTVCARDCYRLDLRAPNEAPEKLR